MSYGFEVRNSAGKLIVDSTHPRMGVSGKQDILSDADGRLILSGFNSTPADLFMVKTDVGDSLTFIPFGSWAGYKVAPSTTREVAAIANYASISQPTGYGIVVYDAAGQVTFSSSAPIVSIREVINGVYPLAGGTFNISISSDVTHIYVMNGLYGMNTGGIIFGPGFLRTSATNIQLGPSGGIAPGVPYEYGPQDTNYSLITARILNV